ncbi:magnesium/cobalt transporter CorA [Haloarchaeobius sp. DYHT-AS-18]|uniref:magnesium/cobalt transporter CorA n=1 Tax=Haloarchaeobius sp. DYHT-AS-18 TaxID=3446117 RepID=UPI003EBE6F53
MTIQSHVFDSSGVNDHEDLAEAKAADGTTWIRVSDATPEEMEDVAGTFGIHELELDDVRNDVRPKTEVFPDHVFTLVKTAVLRAGDTTFEEEVRSETVGLFIGKDWLVTLSLTTLRAVGKVWNAVTREDQRILSRGPDFTAYRILDNVTNDYFGLIDEVEDDIEAVEEEVVGATGMETLEDLNSLRRELLSIRRVLWPSRDAVAILARGEDELIEERHEKYFRDVYDQLVQLVELIETYRDLVTGARDIYLNSISMNMNEVMKTLTVVATIILPLTFVVGIYGMNFSVMPELGWDYAYHAIMLGMVGIAAIMILYFREESWL